MDSLCPTFRPALVCRGATHIPLSTIQELLTFPELSEEQWATSITRHRQTVAEQRELKRKLEEMYRLQVRWREGGSVRAKAAPAPHAIHMPLACAASMQRKYGVRLRLTDEGELVRDDSDEESEVCWLQFRGVPLEPY